MAEINDLEIVDASNIGRFPENQAPSTVNDGARALEGIIARWHLDTNGALAAGGTADVITLAANQTLTALTTGANFTFVASGNNTGAVTVNVDAIGAVGLKTVAGAALKAGDLVAGGIYNIRYDGTNYQLNTSLGDVVGPASSTAESLAKFDGTTGRLLKDGAVIGTNVQAYDADTLFADTDDILTAGFAGTDDDDGTQSSGTYTPIYTGGNYKEIVNGGAFTLAPMANTSTLVLQITNNASAGAITTSGWTIVTGDTISTTDADDFMCYLTVNNSFSHLHVVALQ